MNLPESIDSLMDMVIVVVLACGSRCDEHESYILNLQLEESYGILSY
jgi:hypothetical protein